MKKLPIFILLFCGFGFFLWNCQRDTLIDTPQLETQKSQFKTKTIKLEAIPDIKSFLISRSSSNLFSQKSVVDSAIFEQDHILEVIDTLNYTNYTFRFSFPSTPRGVYYNLVVGKTAEGVLKEPFVLKYVSDSTHLNEFIANDYKFSYFRGQMEVHKFTDYFQTGLGLKTEATSCTPAFDAFGDPIPCDVVSFPGSGPSSGGGSTSSSGGSTGTTTCSWYVTYLPCGCGGNADGHAPSGVSCCQGSPSILTKVCSPSHKMPTANKTTSTINPCPDCPTGNDGGVGVSLVDTSINNIINILHLDATDKVRLTWLKQEATPAEIAAINKFLVDNHTSTAAVMFIKEAITALMNNGEVDFAEKVIIDATFKDNPRLKCVYDKFKTGTNTISNYLENFLGEKPVAHLNLKADDNFKANYSSDYWGAGAITTEPVNYNINIVFNTDANLASSELNMPTIILAAELIHEMIHAEMYRKLLSYAQQPNIPWTEEFIHSLKNDFRGLADYYTRWWLNLPPSSPPTSAQHQAMAQHYIEMIIAALKDFDNYQHSEEFYNALAWIGLKNTVAWDNFNNQNAVNTLISNTIKNETHNCTN